MRTTSVTTSIFALAIAALPLSAWGQDRAPAAGTSGASGDIIVTARRVEESIQNVPISITVFNQSQLNDRNITSAADLALYTPSLVANARFGIDNSSFSIRGVTQEPRTTASVATYFADVVAPRGNPGGTISGDGAGPGSYFDLANVQVLKGPQGTLFGRNTTGGAILLVPQKPTNRLEGYVEGSLGNYHMRRLQGVINLPLSDSARLRLGADYQKRDGYIKNLSPVGPGAFGDLSYFAARASLVVDLAPTLENYTIGTYALSRNNGVSGHMEGAFPTNNGRATAFGNLAAQAVARQAAGGVYSTENDVADPLSRLETFQIINTTKWAVTSNLTVKNIASYGQLKSFLRFDPYSTYFPLGATYQAGNGSVFAVAPQYQGALVGFATVQANDHGIADQSAFTEELQFLGVNGALTWQAGAYYERSKGRSAAGTAGPAGGLVCSNVAALQCTDVLGAVQGSQGLVGNMQVNDAVSRIQNVAVYAQGSYAVTDNLTFTAGLRYTWDKTDTIAHTALLRFPQPDDPRLYCLTLAGPLGPTGANFSNALASGQGAVANALGNACLVNLHQSSQAPTWVAGLDFKPVDGLLLYGKYSRGYRQGSTNPFGATGFQTYQPEKLNAYEIGVKGNWRGPAPGYLNISAFYNDFENIQVTAAAVDLSGRIAPNTYITNGTSRTKGVEIETGVTLLRSVKLNASYAYLDSALKSIVAGALPVPSVYNFLQASSVVGQPLPFTPTHALSAGISYMVPVARRVGHISVGATYSYTSKSYSTYSNIATGSGLMPAHDLVNANLNWNGVGGSPADIALFGTNIFNSKYVLNANDAVSSGFFTRVYGPPAMYGVRVRYHF